MFSASMVRSGSREDRLERKVFDVAEEFGLDVEGELEDVNVSYLEPHVNARTRLDRGRVKIDFSSSNFFSKSENRKKRIILHELIHVKQFNNSLHEWAREELDVSEDFAGELEDAIWKDVKDIEGETEMLVSNLFPSGGNSSYPHEKNAKESEMKRKGFDIDSEISEGTEGEMDQLYREVTDVSIGENIYVEEGTIGDQDYKVAVMGEYAAEKGPAQVEDYLEESFEGYEGRNIEEEEYIADKDDLIDVTNVNSDPADYGCGCS